MRDVSVDDLKGRSVVDENGVALGQVKDLTFDPDAWRVTGIRVGLSRETADRLHVQKPLLGAPEVTFSADRIRAVGDAVILNLDERTIADMLLPERR